MPDGFFLLSYDLHHIATKTKKETLALRVVILVKGKDGIQTSLHRACQGKQFS